jgi:hypothetical protein
MPPRSGGAGRAAGIDCDTQLGARLPKHRFIDEALFAASRKEAAGGIPRVLVTHPHPVRGIWQLTPGAWAATNHQSAQTVAVGCRAGLGFPYFCWTAPWRRERLPPRVPPPRLVVPVSPTPPEYF